MDGTSRSRTGSSTSAPSVGAGAPLDEHARGLGHDLPRLLGRRGLRALLGARLGMAAPAAPSSGRRRVDVVSSGRDVLAGSGFMRRDLTASFGPAEGTVDGVSLDLYLELYDAGEGDAPLAGTVVYLWHADAVGRYSLYSDGATEQNWLRGVQVADASGRVRFTTIVPGCGRDRWPHVHFEVYADLETAASGGMPRVTADWAVPPPVCEQAYETPRYGGSADNLAGLSPARALRLGRDDGTTHLGATCGNVTDGFESFLAIGIHDISPATRPPAAGSPARR